MALRLTSLDQLAACSPHVRAQLEKHLVELPAQPAALEQAEGRAVAKKRARPEQDAGKALVKWMDALVLPNGLKPGLFFCHIPNGGFRDPIEAAIFYGQGVRKGWPDYLLLLPRGPFHGLVLELKAEQGNKPDPEQLEILGRLEAAGYAARVAWGFEEARHAIESYLACGK